MFIYIKSCGSVLFVLTSKEKTPRFIIFIGTLIKTRLVPSVFNRLASARKKIFTQAQKKGCNESPGV